MKICPLISLVIASLTSSVTGDQPNINVKSAPFGSALKRLAWAGSSGFDCDLKCKQACFAISPEDAAQVGDTSHERSDACVAGCGCGGGSETVFATLDNGEAYISTDSGREWNDLKKQVPSYLHREPHHLRHVYTSHTDPRSVVLLTNTTTSWISHDGGSSWKALRLTSPSHGERRITAWRWHPSRKDWAIAESRDPTAKATVDGSKNKQSNFLAFYTQDGGLSFQLIAENVDQCHWAIRPNGNSRRILVTRYVQTDKPGSPVEIYSSEDFLSTHTVLLGKGAPAGGPRAAIKVLFHYNFIFAVVPAWGPSGEPKPWDLQLWFHNEAAQRPGEAKPFRAAKWPRQAQISRPGQLRQMQVLHSAEDMALLYVPAANQDLPWGHVFSCSYHRRELLPVLTDVRRSGSFGEVAWQAVAGIDGAFIANRAVLPGNNLDQAEKKLNAQEAVMDDDQSAIDAQEETSTDGNDKEVGRASGVVKYITRTYVTFDMGNVWQPLNAGLAWASGSTMPGCEHGPRDENCQLHLARWESSFAAPGIILGVGNTGLQLSSNQEHHSVFLSRDSGLNWREVLSGPYKVAILGHGDMLVAVSIKSPGSLSYSTDNGRTWSTTTVAASKDQGLAVEGIFSHPSRMDLQVYIALSSEARPGIVLASMDLSAALKTPCKLPSSPGTSDSDFEKWSPSDSMEDSHASKRPTCLLGVRTSYIRRKERSVCKTGATKLPPLDLRKDTPCQCTAADWSCDAGYHRASYTADAPCELLDDSPAPNVTELCMATFNDYTEVTRGYARIVGNRCIGGVDLSPTRHPCPNNTGLTAVLRSYFYSSRLHMVSTLAAVLFLIVFAVQRQQRGRPGSRGFRKKYEDSRSYNPDDDDIERELLIDKSDL